MKKGDVETYIERFETLRRSVDWLEENNGTITQFQRGLGATHTRKVREGKAPHPITLKDCVTAPRGRVTDKRLSSGLNDLGNRGKVPQVLGTSQEGIEFETEFPQLRNRCRSKRRR